MTTEPDARRADPNLTVWPVWATVPLAIAIGVTPPLAYAFGTLDVVTAEAALLLVMWGAVGMVLAHWVLAGRPPSAWLPVADRGAIVPVITLSAVSAISGALDLGSVRALVPFALACAAPMLVRIGDGALLRLAARFGQFVATILSTALFAVLGLLSVCLPWLVQRPLRVDPLGSTDAWTLRRRGPTSATRMWSPDAAASRRSMAVRVGRATVWSIAVLALIVAVAPIRTRLVALVDPPQSLREPFRLGAGLLGIDVHGLDGLTIRDRVDDRVTEHRPDPNDIQAAMAGSAWFYDTAYYNTAQGWALEPDAAWRPINPYRLLDFRSLLLNVVGGSRSSWRPPECDCRRLTVWMYGGSTTYGLNQRDEHTIASELARVAHDHGITIDISNRGANGHLHWMEAERFAWDLTMEEAPDMVIFYDGVNEAWAGGSLNAATSGDKKPPVDPTTQDIWKRTGRSIGAIPQGPPGSELIGDPENITLDLGELEPVIVERYDRARTLSRTAADAHGIAVRYLWQPSRFSRPLVPSEPHLDGQAENYSRASEQLMLAALPDNVIDVSDALRGTDEPLFTDDVHHNETGARLIAERIFERIGDDLETLADAESEG